VSARELTGPFYHVIKPCAVFQTQSCHCSIATTNDGQSKIHAIDERI